MGVVGAIDDDVSLRDAGSRGKHLPARLQTSGPGNLPEYICTSSGCTASNNELAVDRCRCGNIPILICNKMYQMIANDDHGPLPTLRALVIVMALCDRDLRAIGKSLRDLLKQQNAVAAVCPCATPRE
jgi:hypothetical protein